MKNMNLLMCLLCASLAACGGPLPGDGSGAEDNRKMSEDFAGVWSATATNSPGWASAPTYTITITVSGPDLRVSGICQDGSGILSTAGNGRGAMWYGEVSCPAPVDGCPSASARYTSAVVKLMDGAELSITLSGTMSSCGDTSALTTTLRGTRQ